MGTTFNYIIDDNCLGMIDDYKINDLYKKTHGTEPEWPIEKYNGYVDGFLYIAIGRFSSYCDHLLYDNREFTTTLTPLEVEILAFYWIIAWARREVNNSSQIQLKLKTPSGFTFSSEGSTLKAKLIWIDSLEEEVNRKITQYQLNEGNLNSYNW